MAMQVHKVEVKEPPQGMAPPVQSSLKKPSQMPTKVRKFTECHSAGLRVRAHPSLQSEQIGLVTCNDTVTFADEVRTPCLVVLFWWHDWYNATSPDHLV